MSINSNDNEVFFPTEVVEMNLGGDSLIKAWRRYKKMSQAELAQKIGVTQGAIAQVEKSDKPHKNTVKKIAQAMGLTPEHLTE